MEETSADNTARLFPYLKDRFQALHEIRLTDYDNAKISNMGRRFAKNGVLGKRIASLPVHILKHWEATYGFPITFDKKMFRVWLNQHPEYKT